eukprot:gene10971-12133_t
MATMFCLPRKWTFRAQKKMYLIAIAGIFCVHIAMKLKMPALQQDNVNTWQRSIPPRKLLNTAEWEKCDYELGFSRNYSVSAKLWHTPKTVYIWVALYIFLTLAIFVALAIVCDDFFVPSLESISEKLDLSEDVAGATFMAAGSSAPELFTSIAGVTVESDVGVGTIVGSAVFNLLGIVALSATFAGATLNLDWRPLLRDSVFYAGSIGLYIVFSWDGKFYLYESIIMLSMYTLYILIMKFNRRLMDLLARCSRKAPIIHPSCDGKNPALAFTLNSTKDEIANSERFTNCGTLSSSRSSITENVDANVNMVSQKSIDISSPVDSRRFSHIKKGQLAHSITGAHDLPLRRASFSTQNEDKKASLLQDHGSIEIKEKESNFDANQRSHEPNGNGNVSPKNQRKEDEEKNGEESQEQVHEGIVLCPCCPCCPVIKTEIPSRPETEGCLRNIKLFMNWILFIISFPFVVLLSWTIPDCSKPRLQKYFIVSFVMSVVWIAVLSFALVTVVGRCGCILGVDKFTMGLVVVAIGTSVPDALSSILVARDGYGDMAVSNAIGSNVFDIDLGLGLPFLISILIRRLKPIKLLSPVEENEQNGEEQYPCLIKNNEEKEDLPFPVIEDYNRSSNIPESIFNLVNSIIGGGIIGLSYAFRVAGMPVGLILLLFCGLITDVAINILLKCGEMSKKFTYQGVVKKAFGKPGLVLISIAQFVFPLSVMMAYGVAISDNIPKVFVRSLGEDTILANRQFVNGMATLLIMLPLSLPRNIALLDKFSAVSIICVLFYSVVIWIRAGTLSSKTVHSEDAWVFAKGGGMAQAFGVMAFSYACLHSVFPMYRALENTSVARYSKVVHSSVVLTSLFYISVAVAGYVTFTNMSQGNLLNNYCPDDDLVNVARFVFALTIILTYPIQVFTSREVIEVGFFENCQRSKIRHVVITVLLIGVATAVSMTTSCLGLVIEVAGCFSASPLVFIFPPLCYIKLRNEGYFKWRYMHLYFLVLFGIAIMVLGTSMAFLTQAGNCSFKEANRKVLLEDVTVKIPTIEKNGTRIDSLAKRSSWGTPHQSNLVEIYRHWREFSILMENIDLNDERWSSSKPFSNAPEAQKKKQKGQTESCQSDVMTEIKEKKPATGEEANSSPLKVNMVKEARKKSSDKPEKEKTKHKGSNAASGTTSTKPRKETIFIKETSKVKPKPGNQTSKKTVKKKPKKEILDACREQKIISGAFVCDEPPCDDDHWIECELCNTFYHGECALHPVQLIKDTKTNSKSKARASIPSMLYLKKSSIENAGQGVFAAEKINSRVRFGPYLGKKHSDYTIESNYQWEVHKNKEKSYVIDASSERASNWMRYINCARFEAEQNLVAIQYHGEIFYQTYKPIEHGDELLVWYGKQFGSALGLCTADGDSDNLSDETISTPRENHDTCPRKVTKKTFPETMCEMDGCERTFETIEELNSHIRAHKSQLSNCIICGQSFSDDAQLKDHFINNHKHILTPQYICEYCNQTFGDRTQMFAHKLEHTCESDTSGATFPPVASTTAADCDSTSAHLEDKLTDRNADGNTDRNTDPNTDSNTDRNRDGNTDRKTDGNTDRNTDVKKIKKEGPPVKTDDQSVYPDVLDAMKFKGTFCKICATQLKTPKEIVVHFDTIHDGEITELIWRCEECRVYYRSMLKLLDHCRVKHNLTLPIQCPICNEILDSSKTWARHYSLHQQKNYFKRRKKKTEPSSGKQDTTVEGTANQLVNFTGDNSDQAVYDSVHTGNGSLVDLEDMAIGSGGLSVQCNMMLGTRGSSIHELDETRYTFDRLISNLLNNEMNSTQSVDESKTIREQVAGNVTENANFFRQMLVSDFGAIGGLLQAQESVDYAKTMAQGVEEHAAQEGVELINTDLNASVMEAVNSAMDAAEEQHASKNDDLDAGHDAAMHEKEAIPKEVPTAGSLKDESKNVGFTLIESKICDASPNHGELSICEEENIIAASLESAQNTDCNPDVPAESSLVRLNLDSIDQDCCSQTSGNPDHVRADLIGTKLDHDHGDQIETNCKDRENHASVFSNQNCLDCGSVDLGDPERKSEARTECPTGESVDVIASTFIEETSGKDDSSANNKTVLSLDDLVAKNMERLPIESLHKPSISNFSTNVNPVVFDAKEDAAYQSDLDSESESEEDRLIRIAVEEFMKANPECGVPPTQSKLKKNVDMNIGLEVPRNVQNEICLFKTRFGLDTGPRNNGMDSSFKYISREIEKSKQSFDSILNQLPTTHRDDLKYENNNYSQCNGSVIDKDFNFSLDNFLDLNRRSLEKETAQMGHLKNGETSTKIANLSLIELELQAEKVLDGSTVADVFKEVGSSYYGFVDKPKGFGEKEVALDISQDTQPSPSKGTLRQRTPKNLLITPEMAVDVGPCENVPELKSPFQSYLDERSEDLFEIYSGSMRPNSIRNIQRRLSSKENKPGLSPPSSPKSTQTVKEKLSDACKSSYSDKKPIRRPNRSKKKSTVSEYFRKPILTFEKVPSKVQKTDKNQKEKVTCSQRSDGVDLPLASEESSNEECLTKKQFSKDKQVKDRVGCKEAELQRRAIKRKDSTDTNNRQIKKKSQQLAMTRDLCIKLVDISTASESEINPGLRIDESGSSDTESSESGSSESEDSSIDVELEKKIEETQAYILLLEEEITAIKKRIAAKQKRRAEKRKRMKSGYKFNEFNRHNGKNTARSWSGKENFYEIPKKPRLAILSSKQRHLVVDLKGFSFPLIKVWRRTGCRSNAILVEALKASFSHPVIKVGEERNKETTPSCHIFKDKYAKVGKKEEREHGR